MFGKIFAALAALSLAVSPVIAKGGSYSSSSYSSGSSRSYSSPSYSSSSSRSYSTPSYSSSPRYSAPAATVATPRYSTPAYSARPAQTTVRPTYRQGYRPTNYGGYNGPAVQNHYYGGGGGGTFSSPWFWMWAASNHNQQPVYVNGGGGGYNAQAGPAYQQADNGIGIGYVLSILFQIVMLIVLIMGLVWAYRKFVK